MIIDSGFRALPWLRNPHLQTLFAAARPTPRLQLRRERIDLPDGDFLDLDWNEEQLSAAAETPAQTPIIMVLHGLTGSIRSKYLRGLMRQLRLRGWRAVLMHFRGASEEPNRLARGYHSGETEDFDYALRLLKTRYPAAPFAAVGYSVGGNVLLKWLGERGVNAPLKTAVAVSVPFDLRLSARAINQGFSRLYQARLLHAMRANAMAKFSRIEPPFALPKLAELRDFHAYDAAMTAPLHGFAGVDDYYDRCSSRQFLKKIRVPTLILHAVDDPFMSPDVIPTEAELSGQVTLALSAQGGHVGFISAGPRGQPQFWLESRIPQHLDAFLPA